MTYSFQDRPGSKFGPPIENEKNRIFYMKYAACETLQSLGLLLLNVEINLKQPVSVLIIVAMAVYEILIPSDIHEEVKVKHILIRI